MDAEYCSDNIFKVVRTIAQHLARYLGIGALIVLISLVLADKVKATYLLSDFNRAGTYIDSRWYHILDYGQYYYLDKGQYNLIGELGYFLGHPFYPKLYEKYVDQKIGFTNIINKGWFIFLDEQFLISRYEVRINHYFNTDDSIFRQRYYFLDMGQYNYLEKRQYNLLGGSAHSFRRPYYPGQSVAGIKTPDVVTNPEPSTIVFLGLGAIGIVALRKKSKTAAVA
jgi:hypothetical protein